MQFQFLLPTKIVMEPGLRQRTGEHLLALGLSHVHVKRPKRLSATRCLKR